MNQYNWLICGIIFIVTYCVQLNFYLYLFILKVVLTLTTNASYENKNAKHYIIFFPFLLTKKWISSFWKKQWIKWRVCEYLLPLVYIHSILVSFADMKYRHCHQLQLTMVKRLWHLIFLKCLQMHAHAHPDHKKVTHNYFRHRMWRQSGMCCSG